MQEPSLNTYCHTKILLGARPRHHHNFHVCIRDCISHPYHLSLGTMLKNPRPLVYLPARHNTLLAPTKIVWLVARSRIDINTQIWLWKVSQQPPCRALVVPATGRTTCCPGSCHAPKWWCMIPLFSTDDTIGTLVMASHNNTTLMVRDQDLPFFRGH